jgi:hypothetical protein
MRASLPFWLALFALMVFSACAPAASSSSKWHLFGHKAKSASAKAKARSKPVYAARTATLDVIPGVHVVGVVSLPSDFVPDLSRPPLWLRNGEIGVMGVANGRATVLGFSGQRLETRRLIAQDFGSAAPGGRMLDFVPSPDEKVLAIALAQPMQNRLVLQIAPVANPSGGSPALALDGYFDAAQLTWLGNSSLALVAHAANVVQAPDSAAGVLAQGGLYILNDKSQPPSYRLDLPCALSSMVFSPNSQLAVTQGAVGALPAIIDLRHSACHPLPFPGRIKVLGWAPDSSAFLYSPDPALASEPGVYRFDLTTGRSGMIALSSGAAAYANDGTIFAVGSQELSSKLLARYPDNTVKVQIARFQPNQNQVTLNSLGFDTQPALLAQTTMSFSQASNDAIIDTALPGIAGRLREVIEYSYATGAAYVLASGAVEGPVAISWSPNGRSVAIADGNSSLWTLMVLGPAR